MLHHGARAAAGNVGGATPGQMVWTALSGTTSGAVDSYSWVVPDGVTEIHAVLVGAGRSGRVSDTSGYGGHGGDLRYTIDPISVTPGETLTIEAGCGAVSSSASYIDGGVSSIKRGASTLIAAGNQYNGSSSAISASIGGGNGGAPGVPNSTWASGGGGAAGYTGNGGSGQSGSGAFSALPSGGGAYGAGYSTGQSACGGGVGLMGEGASGTTQVGDGQQGSDGYFGYDNNGFGGGGGGNDAASGTTNASGMGGVRIIWGEGRGFPDPIDAADYIPETDIAYNEIELKITPDNTFFYKRFHTVNVYDENGVDIMPSLTAVAGSFSSTFASLSAGQFTIQSRYSLTSAEVGTLNDNNDTTFVNVDTPSPYAADTTISILIKPATAKKISKVRFRMYFSSINNYLAKIQYIEIVADGLSITNGRVIPARSYQYAVSPFYTQHELTFT